MFTTTYNKVKNGNKKEIIQLISAILAIVAMVLAAFVYIDTRYARCEDVNKSSQSIATGLKKLEQRLDYKITSDQYKDTEQRIYRIEDRMKGKPINEWPQDVKDEYRRLQSELKALDKELSNIKSEQAIH
jgi:prefoldin subunit 5